MDSGRATEVFVIDDFPGFFSGISRSKLPPGALVDWGVGKGSSRSLGVEVSNQGELVASHGLSRVASIPLTPDISGINSCFFWEAPQGGARIFLGQHTGVYEVFVSETVTGGPGNPTHDYFLPSTGRIPFVSAFFQTSWITPEASHLRRGKFVPYGKYVYYCDGVSYPLRIRGIEFTAAPMGVGSETTGSSNAVSIDTTPYGTKHATSSNTTQYWVTWLSELGESPAMVEAVRWNISIGLPIVRIDWTGVPNHIYGVNIYRTPVGDTIPRFLAFMPRGETGYVDNKEDDLLGYPIPLTLGYPSSFRTMEIFDDRMFAVGGYGDPNRVSCSQVGQPDVWPPLNIINFTGGGRNELIEELRVISGNLYLFTPTSIYRLRGTGPENYTFDLVSPKVGCVARATMFPWNDGVVFLSFDGIYFFNGSRLTRVSDGLTGLFTRPTPGVLGWRSAVGAVAGDTYFLAYNEMDETAFYADGSATDYVETNNRVISVNLVGGKAGVRNGLGFTASCPCRGVESLVTIRSATDSSVCLLDLLSNHPSQEFGTEVQSVPETTNLFLADLDFGDPDRVKILDAVELFYEALQEFAISCTVYRSYPVSDPGVTFETSSVSAVVPTDTQVYEATAWPGNFGLLHQRRAMFHFTIAQGKSFNVGFAITNDAAECRIVRAVFRYHTERSPWLGSGVS